MSSTRQSRSYTVSEVAQLLSDTLRSTFPTMRVVGEISNFFRARSGHWYFRLKDDKAQIECAMFAADARGVAFAPADGDEVEITDCLLDLEDLRAEPDPGPHPIGFGLHDRMTSRHAGLREATGEPDRGAV